MKGYRVVNHRFPSQHIREYPRALANDQNDVLQLEVKQYIPNNNPNPQPGDVTIVAAHANGFPKELYEPLWEELLSNTQNKWRIRSIWMADVAHQGASLALNEPLLGNDPSWLDHSRDLLHLINLKRDEMPQPIVGIGHSMGGGQLAYLAYFHPRLFTTLVFIDPVISENRITKEMRERPDIAQLSTFRRDVWPSREAAAKAFLKSPFYQKWNQRVFQKWIDYGLRETPTLLHPEAQPPSVTLSTSVAHEVYQFVRPNYEASGHKGKPVNRHTHADLNPNLDYITPFYRPEPPAIFYRLAELRPSLLYIFGADSDVSTPEQNKLKLAITGTGVGGSGGEKEGRVKGITFEGIGHLVAMEAVERTAEVIGSWVGDEIQIWQGHQQQWETDWKTKSLREKQAIDEKWIKGMGGSLDRFKKSNKKPSKI